MKIPVRNAAVVLGIFILGCVLIAVIEFTKSSPTGNESDMDSGAARGNFKGANDPLGGPGSGATASIEMEEPRKAKSGERPSDAELARKRLERRRMEIVEALERYKSGGLGGSHPAVVKAMNDLKKIEAEQAAVGDSDKPAN